jgi:hypothetical protein
MSKATVVSTPRLAELNYRAVRERRNRALTDECIDALDPEGIHVLMFSMVHNDCEMRTQWMLKFRDRDAADSPLMGFVDMTFEDFNALPTLDMVHDAPL